MGYEINNGIGETLWSGNQGNRIREIRASLRQAPLPKECRGRQGRQGIRGK